MKSGWSLLSNCREASIDSSLGAGDRGAVASDLQPLVRWFSPGRLPPLQHVIAELREPLLVLRPIGKIVQFVWVGFEIVEVLVAFITCGVRPTSPTRACWPAMVSLR